MKKIIGLSLIAALALSVNVNAADTKFTVSGNAALTTNYLWRGISYTAGSATAQTGIDMDNLFNVGGLHLNLWGSGIQEGSEIDTIIGYSMELGKVGLDISYINYYYTLGAESFFPQTFSGATYGELYVNLTYSDYGVTVYEENDFDGTTVQLDGSFGPVDLSGGYYMVPSDNTSNFWYASVGVNWDCQLLPTYGMNATVAYNSGQTANANAAQPQTFLGMAGTEGYTFALTLSKDF